MCHQTTFRRQTVLRRRLKVLHRQKRERSGQKVHVEQSELRLAVHRRQGRHHLTESEVARVPPKQLHWLNCLQPMLTKRPQMRH